MESARNLVEWRLLPFDSGTVRSETGALTAYIDGEPLTAIVSEFELGRGFEPAGGYVGLMESLTPAEWRAFFLLGQRPEDLRYVSGTGAPLLGCGCGDVGCWPLLVRIVRENDIVRWERFEQPHRRQREYSGLGPFVFDAQAYEHAVEHAVVLESSRIREPVPADDGRRPRDEDDPEARRLHLIVLARELAATANVPLRDRHWLAIPDDEVMHVVDAVSAHADDAWAVAALDAANFKGDIELCQSYYRPCDEDALQRIVAALRPLTANNFALARFQPGRQRRRTAAEWAIREAAVAMHGEPDD